MNEDKHEWIESKKKNIEWNEKIRVSPPLVSFRETLTNEPTLKQAHNYPNEGIETNMNECTQTWMKKNKHERIENKWMYWMKWKRHEWIEK